MTEQTRPAFVLVPTEPTDEMMEAGDQANPTVWDGNTDAGFGLDVAYNIYRAMIARAAPPATDDRGLLDLLYKLWGQFWDKHPPGDPKDTLRELAAGIASLQARVSSTEESLRQSRDHVCDLKLAEFQHREALAAAEAERGRLRLFYRAVAKAAGDLEGLPDGHAFELVWCRGNTPDPEFGFITAGMIRRAALKDTTHDQ